MKQDPLKNRYATLLRNRRQTAIATWVRQTFGTATMTVEERACRFVEEAVELAQAVGLTEERVRTIVAYVYKKDPGKVAQEVGGVGITLLALAEVASVSADAEEVTEMQRVLQIPREVFRKRHDIKAAAGIAAPSGDR